MSENMEKFRHIDGSEGEIDRDYLTIVLQRGNPSDTGVNGCRLEDVIIVLEDKLREFQSREMVCDENEIAIHHLSLAREALQLRQQRREQQGLVGERKPHKPRPVAEAKTQ